MFKVSRSLLKSNKIFNTSITVRNKYTVVLVRHGESVWNDENRFTGWYDCPLSEKGNKEAAAGMYIVYIYMIFTIYIYIRTSIISIYTLYISCIIILNLFNIYCNIYIYTTFCL